MTNKPFVIVSRQRSSFGSVTVGATWHTNPECGHTKHQRGGRMVALADLGFTLETQPCKFCAKELTDG